MKEKMSNIFFSEKTKRKTSFNKQPWTTHDINTQSTDFMNCIFELYNNNWNENKKNLKMVVSFRLWCNLLKKIFDCYSPSNEVINHNAY